MVKSYPDSFPTHTYTHTQHTKLHKYVISTRKKNHKNVRARTLKGQYIERQSFEI